MRRSWVVNGAMVFVTGIALLVALLLIPLFLVTGIVSVLLGLVLPENRGFYFVYDVKARRLIKKRA